MTDNKYDTEYVPVENSQGHMYKGKLVREEKNLLGRVNARIYECYDVIGNRPFAYLAVYKGVSGPLYMINHGYPEERINAALRRAKNVYRGRQNVKRQAARQSRVY